MAKKVKGSGTSFRGSTVGAIGNKRKKEYAKKQNQKALNDPGKGS